MTYKGSYSFVFSYITNYNNYPNFLTFEKFDATPIAPYTAKFPSLDFVLYLSNSYPTLPSIPKLK